MNEPVQPVDNERVIDSSTAPGSFWKIFPVFVKNNRYKFIFLWVFTILGLFFIPDVYIPSIDRYLRESFEYFFQAPLITFGAIYYYVIQPASFAPNHIAAMVIVIWPYIFLACVILFFYLFNKEKTGRRRLLASSLLLTMIWYISVPIGSAAFRVLFSVTLGPYLYQIEEQKRSEQYASDKEILEASKSLSDCAKLATSKSTFWRECVEKHLSSKGDVTECERQAKLIENSGSLSNECQKIFKTPLSKRSRLSFDTATRVNTVRGPILENTLYSLYFPEELRIKAENGDVVTISYNGYEGENSCSHRDIESAALRFQVGDIIEATGMPYFACNPATASIIYGKSVACNVDSSIPGIELCQSDVASSIKKIGTIRQSEIQEEINKLPRILDNAAAYKLYIENLTSGGGIPLTSNQLKADETCRKLEGLSQLSYSELKDETQIVCYFGELGQCTQGELNGGSCFMEHR